ncbi:MAG: sensor histidine kinase [Methylococcaceae bacterium]
MARPSLIRHLSVYLLILGLFLSGNGMTETLELTRSASLKDLSRHVGILEDIDGTLTTKQVMALNPSDWSTTEERILKIAYSTSTWWIRIDLNNAGDTPASRIIEVAWPLLNYLDVYRFEQDQNISTLMTGDQRPYANRPLPTRTFAIPFEVDAGHQQTLLLRLAMHSGILYAIPLKLWLKPDFHEHLTQENLLHGAYFGAILALLLYNVLLFLSTKDNNLLLYSFYLGGFTLWNLGFDGLGLQYLWRDTGWFNLQFNLLAPGYIHGLATLFVVRYLETRERAIFLHRIIMFVTGLTLIILPFSLANQSDPSFPIVLPAYLFTVMSSVLITLYLLTGIWLMQKNFRPARYFVLAWSCLFAGIFVYRMTQFPGLGIADHPLMENSINLGSALEFLLLALALGDRFNRLRNDKLEAEQEAYRLQVNYSNDLAEQVEYRTRALQHTMSQLHQALEAERHAQEEQRQFLATVSHELRTPLAVIDIVAQNLEIDENHANQSERRLRYDKIQQATRRLSSLLDNYLDENRFSLLKRGPQRQPTDLRQLLEDAANSARVLADRHRLIVTAERLSTEFNCDPDLTRLALRNLADNAVKYTPPGTAVILSGDNIDGGIFLTITDEGKGLPEAVLERVFLPGQRGQDTENKPGWGMGLPLARRMIETQGGTLTATSTPGQGCIFQIWLPDIDAEEHE